MTDCAGILTTKCSLRRGRELATDSEMTESLITSCGLSSLNSSAPGAPGLRHLSFRCVSLRFVALLLLGDETDRMAGMSEAPATANETNKSLCNYPGCTRPRRPDPATGRPSRYCERDDDGGPVHNRANAWKARRVQRDNATTREDGLSAPVSMARATLEQRLSELPERIADLHQYFDGIVIGIRAAGDVEAAGSEVEDAHRDALTKVTEAERRATAAERAARSANENAQAAQQEREEADALAEEAMAEVARIREEARAEVVQAAAAATLAQQQLAEAEDGFAARLAERDAEVEQARRDVTAAQVEAASALAAQHAATEAATRARDSTAQLRQDLEEARRAVQEATAETAAVRAELAVMKAQAAAAERASETDRESLTALRSELERHRAEARSERESLRTTHAEQLTQFQRNADERVKALTEALTAAQGVVQRAGTGKTAAAPKRAPRGKTIKNVDD